MGRYRLRPAWLADMRCGKGQGAATCAVQPYLLDMASYSLASGGSGVAGREFQVLANSECRGARIKTDTDLGTSTYILRLWRVDTQAQIAQGSFMVTAVGIYVALFDAPASLVTTTAYRLTINRDPGDGTGNIKTYVLFGCDHPDGPVTVLTANTYVGNSEIAYPSSESSALSFAMEPIICTPAITFYLLKEDGDALLKEDGDHLLKEDAT